ncbi:MAG TPA: hypothetical protein VFM38_00215, partial [Candidatus Limnocylindrales bacterium]|nr:hypothetical protein [Candidatus Limnocylindrales bacterium]
VGAAIELHAGAAEGWRRFGAPLEEAHSQLGHARCLAAVGRSAESAMAAGAALEIGERLGARQVTAEAAALRAGAGRGRGAARAPAG